MRTPNPASQSTTGPQRWAVPSSQFKTNGITYTVTARVDTGELECDCPARKVCWHIKAVASSVVGKPRVRYMPAAPVPQRGTHLSVDDRYPQPAAFRRTRGGDVLAEGWGRAVSA